MKDFWNEFHGPNLGYVIDQYERFLQNPDSVEPALRAMFSQIPPEQAARLRFVEAAPAAAASDVGLEPLKVAAALNLAQAIRWYGHFDAQLDPLGSPPPGDPALDLSTYGLNESDLRQIPAGVIGGVAGEHIERQSGTAWDAIQYLREIYSDTIGFDYLQNRNPEERQWLREAAESRRFAPENEPIDPLGLLEQLTDVAAFEQFLQRTFVAQTRFSIEGLDMLVPMLDVAIGCAARAGIYKILIGMAHRGRLNVLAHILNKPIQQILAEFKDPLRLVQNNPLGFTGDVKYHAGASTMLDEEDCIEAIGDEDCHTVNLNIVLAPNPSHLEAVNPVVEGMARAAGTLADEPGPTVFDPSITLPVLIHGDAAFLGEGVVAETLNLHGLEGYTTGGTIHIIANNQIGFTTLPSESRSTTFASDLAKGFRIPIIHVNADDPAACITAARTAFAFRAQFHRDFVIDLIGYRRRGHNEGDEPAFTQPKIYQVIDTHPSVRELWAGRLVEQGLAEADQPERLYQQKLQQIQRAFDELDASQIVDPIPEVPPPGAAKRVHTAVPAEQLVELYRELRRLPADFNLHPRLARIRKRQEGLLDIDKPTGEELLDWSGAEELAFASILADGTPIRITGQDVERGTFSHRHAVLHDVETGQRYVPLQSIPQARAGFEVYNSPLSEYAALGFEFGYDVQSTDRLVIWEAQYGDFINNAQTIVDEFVVSARDKWGQLPALVALLPHGYEGQGPDHSSGRLERFLGMAADNNLRVANCTTAANYFHLLRRQALLLEVDPLPLIVMTPKSLLRHPLVASPLAQFSEPGWQPVIDRHPLPVKEGRAAPELLPAEEVRRLVICSGKVYIDLVTSDLAADHPETGVVRLEQLAPIPATAFREMLEGYPALDELVWVQEEPENMGAWLYVRPHLIQAVSDMGEKDGQTPALRYAARPRSSSPAEGSHNLHEYNQDNLVEEAYGEHREEPADETRNGKSTADSSRKSAVQRTAR